MNALTSARLQQRLLVAIQTEEPRANVLHVGVTAKEEENGYEIDSMPLIKKTRFGRNTTIAQYNYVEPPKDFIQKMLW